jgi:hypothetical protein
MQINDRSSGLSPREWTMDKIKRDIRYNIAAGVEVLKNKVRLAAKLRRHPQWERLSREYDLDGLCDLEIAVKGYNGLQPSSIYLDLVNQALSGRPWERQLGNVYLVDYTYETFGSQKVPAPPSDRIRLPGAKGAELKQFEGAIQPKPALHSYRSQTRRSGLRPGSTATPSTKKNKAAR